MKTKQAWTKRGGNCKAWEIVAELMRQADRMHPTQLSLQVEGPMEMIRQLRGEIDEYLGIERAKALLTAGMQDR